MQRDNVGGEEKYQRTDGEKAGNGKREKPVRRRATEGIRRLSRALQRNTHKQAGTGTGTDTLAQHSTDAAHRLTE